MLRGGLEVQMDVITDVRQTETYRLRWKEHSWWALFYVDAAHGALSVQSDFGDFSYRWGSPGQPFKEFLVGLDDGYLKMKLSRGRDYFYSDESLRRLRGAVDLKLKEDESTTAELRARCGEALDELEECGDTDYAVFCHLIADGPIGRLFEEYEELGGCLVRGFSPQLDQFVEKIWPEFVAVLRRELSASLA